jgi:hypothetical protein
MCLVDPFSVSNSREMVFTPDTRFKIRSVEPWQPRGDKDPIRYRVHLETV